MAASTLRIATLGKTGTGKSSLGNTIFGETKFEVCQKAVSGASQCKAETGEVDGRNITFIDTLGLFKTHKSEEELKSSLAKCITECSSGVHAFLILIEVGRYTKQEEEVISKIQECFSDEAFKYAVLVFTHGDQLEEDDKIEDFVKTNKSLRDLSKRCGGRCHVVDNKYWNNNQQSEYRNNQFQVKKLLRTVTEMVEKNRGGCYTNDMLQAVKRRIKEEEERIRSESGHMPEEEISKKAKSFVADLLKVSAGITTGMLVGALLAVPALVLKVVELLASAATSPTAIEFVGGVVLEAVTSPCGCHCDICKKPITPFNVGRTVTKLGRSAGITSGSVCKFVALQQKQLKVPMLLWLQNLLSLQEVCMEGM